MHRRPYVSRMRLFRRLIVAGMLLLLAAGTDDARSRGTRPDYQAYLFCYFTGNGGRREAIRFAISDDGFHYRALNGNRPVVDPANASKTGGMRDPHIYRGADGKTFYMVATDMHVAVNGWGPNYGMVLMKSSDLIHWTAHDVNIPRSFPELEKGTDAINRVWAPQTIYDPEARKYMVYWAMRFGTRPDKLYYAYANKDFTGLETVPRQLFFSPDSAACIDADIVWKGGQYHLFFKTEDRRPGIKSAVSGHLTHGYVMKQDRYLQSTDRPVEGSCTFQLNHSDKWILMYDMYTSGKYQFTESADLVHFRPVQDVSLDFHPRHGTVMAITAAERDRLLEKWGPKIPLAANDTTGNHNPVLKGLYADPEILYARKTGKFYIYPTTDGFDRWSGYYFKTFSSSDLVHWKDEGTILNLKTDVTWAKTNAWAPCIIEKKIGGKYQYFFYFVAAGKIGVAVADNPTGPFTDSGKPLIDSLPEGATHGQQIDPDVFSDPRTHKDYLYWGNGYMAGAELNADMVSLKPGTTHIMTPSKRYNEGTYVFYRKGRYYFMWSQNDTRSPDYQVRYGTADSPLGHISVPPDNLVLAKDERLGIYGTGHNSVIRIPDTDAWYIVYHRFRIPDGITMGPAAGYHREVCIDSMKFSPDWRILPVRPTLAGIAPVKVTGK